MFFLKRQLKNASQSAKPSAEFRARLMSELSLAYDQEYGCPQRRPFFVRATAVGLASLVLFFTVGTGVYAYESPEVSEGHPLYFVKSGLESLRERAALTPEARAEFHTQMMERRLTEAEHHFSSRPDRVPPTLEQAADQFEETITALDEGVQDEIKRTRMLDALSIRRARYLELSDRVRTGEEETGELEPLRQRIEGHELTDQELMRLFGTPALMPGSPMGR